MLVRNDKLSSLRANDSERGNLISKQGNFGGHGCPPYDIYDDNKDKTYFLNTQILLSKYPVMV